MEEVFVEIHRVEVLFVEALFVEAASSYKHRVFGRRSGSLASCLHEVLKALQLEVLPCGSFGFLEAPHGLRAGAHGLT